VHELQCEIEIAATPERIWSILTDLPAYPAWNPFIRSISGPIATGQRLAITVQPVASLDRGTKAGFVAMNAALKARAEGLSAPTHSVLG
jgi:hypothetical protein